MKHILLCILLSVLLQGELAAEPLHPDDFAFGYELMFEPGSGAYLVTLPEDVYHTVRRADMSDMGVFNGSREEVPHVLRNVNAARSNVEPLREIPFFPLYGKTLSGEDNLSLKVETTSDGAVIAVNTAISSRGPSGLQGYLLDLGERINAPLHLELEWQQESHSGAFVVALYHSSDLLNWHPLVPRAVLADLEYEGNRVVQRKITLPDVSSRYVKLTWTGGRQPVVIDKIAAFIDRDLPADLIFWQTLDGKASVNDTAGYSIHYLRPTAPAVISARIQFSENNSILLGTIQSRRSEDSSWLTQCEGLFYSLQVGGEVLDSEPCMFPNEVAASSWRLVVQQDGAGLQDAGNRVLLQLGMPKKELVFVARGIPPFILAYGSGAVESDGRIDNNVPFIETIAGSGDLGNLPRAEVGSSLVFGGEPVLESPTQPRPWKKWLLWSLLVGGVMLMAKLALYLISEFKAESQKGS